MAPDLLQVLGDFGQPTQGLDPRLDESQQWDLFRWMLTLRTIDTKMLLLQRQGRVAFYGPVSGQEAAIVGCASALQKQDWIFPALREALGSALIRGAPLDRLLAENFGTVLDVQKGRQMPSHYSWRPANVVAWSSVIATQLPHATGAAMAMKYRGDKAIAVGYIGDGGTSEGDFHVALNFAGVYKAPVVFVCQNNQWAISVSAKAQTASENFAIKAEAYGFPGVRVDGNDVLAVYRVMRDAVARARKGEGPTLIEALTYRMGPHSSSDDPTKYRDAQEEQMWRERDPIDRFRKHLKSRGLWTPAKEETLQAQLDTEVAAAIGRAEAAGPPPLETLIEDVYGDVPDRLRKQLAELETERRAAG
jgi:pyruvate dehydrogenase E1 component alpha subunit/2-oxoisovalerate dehydrogenase E1 component alpha subunit